MKVSRKVGRRSRKHTSSVSRRRLRNKKSRSGYKKRHAKTQRGGTRSRKYGHKRGKRFHRGGGLTDIDPDAIDPDAIDNSDKFFEMVNVDDELTLDPELTTPVLVPTTQDPKLTTPDIPIPSLLVTNEQALPNDIFFLKGSATKIDNALYFEYERTDGRHNLGKMLGVGKPVKGLFDVVILWTGTFPNSEVSHIFLLRRIINKKGKEDYDKKFIIDYKQFFNHFYGKVKINNPFTGIQGYSIHSSGVYNPTPTDYILPTTEQPATYTLLATDNNKKNLLFIRRSILLGGHSPSSRKFFDPNKT